MLTSQLKCLLQLEIQKKRISQLMQFENSQQSRKGMVLYLHSSFSSYVQTLLNLYSKTLLLGIAALELVNILYLQDLKPLRQRDLIF